MNFAIPSGYSMSVTLPSGLEFAIGRMFNIIVNLSSYYIPYSNTTFIVVTNIFSEGIPANTGMQFELTKILNPYGVTTNLPFGVRIYNGSNTYFEDQGDLSINIDTISEFPLFSVTTSNTNVSLNATYTVNFQLGEGNLGQNNFIQLTVPPSVKYCDSTSIILTQQYTGCSNSLSNSYKHSYGDNKYGYESSLCVNYNGTNIQFQISCRNPETTQPTGDFTLQAQTVEQSTPSIYYKSIGSPLTMTAVSHFLSYTITKLNSWLGHSNTFSILIERTSPYTSTDIDQILIHISTYHTIDPTCPSISGTTGITASAPGLTVTCQLPPASQQIIINSVSSLSQTFSFTLPKITNPPLPTQSISFVTRTTTSTGYLSEIGFPTAQYANCDYPCKLCTSTNTNNCTECYSLDHAVFEGGTSMHRLHPGIIATCANICPIHTMETSPVDCVPCDVICSECQDITSNCTKCYDNMFLYINQCIDPCPTGYSNNVDDWTCVEIRGYEAGTQITIVDDIEVEKTACYRFILKPEVELKFTDSNIVITSPPNIGMKSSCYSTLGTCSVMAGTSAIKLTNFLIADYTSGDSPIQFDIFNTYINPDVTYLYSEIDFLIAAQINATIYHSELISVSGNGASDIRYSPHILGGTNPLTSNSSTTVTLSTLSFNVSNTNYSIPNGHKIILTFSGDMRFNMRFNMTPNPPTYTPMENLNWGGILNIVPDASIIIDGIFTTGVVPLDSDIRFDLHNILNPYALGQTTNIILDIAASNGTVDEKQFTLTTGLMVDITNIAEYSAFSVTPSNYVTSANSTYIFSITLGDGAMSTDTRIYIQVPSTVRNCDASTIIGTLGFTSSITETNYIPSSDKYYFNMPSVVPGETIIKFEMECENPETRQITENFMIQSAIITTGDIFYEISGSPVSMTTPNTFESVVITMIENSPLVNNTIRLTVTRTANYPSTHIDQIVILFPDSMNIVAAGYSLISGIISTSTFTISDQKIVIGGITQLLHVFTLDLLFVQNPKLSTDDIKLEIMTRNSGGFKGEREYTNILHTICDFPCQTCEISNVINCESCFPELDPAHPIDIPQAYFLVVNMKRCLDECPLTYYENETAVCDLCDINYCKGCDVTPTNCTSCYPDKFLHMFACITPCPPHYYQNDIDWSCDCNNIYTYIYIYI